MKTIRITPFLFLLLLFLAVPASGIAGSIWLEPQTSDEIRLEGVKPNFKNVDLSDLSMIWFLSGHFEAGINRQIFWDIPFARYSERGEAESSHSIGNPYVGLEAGPEESPFRGEVGIRLPLAADDEEAAFFGAYADMVDRMEAFLPDVVSIIAGTNFRHLADNGISLRLRMAPILWIDTQDALVDQSEIWVRYSGQVMVIGETGSFGIGFSGRYLTTEDSYEGFGEKSLHELGLFANWDLGKWKYGARIRIPWDEEMRELHDTGFIMSLGYDLR